MSRPVLWTRTHDLALDNEIAKALKRREREGVKHGRVMFALGMCFGMWLMYVALEML